MDAANVLLCFFRRGGHTFQSFTASRVRHFRNTEHASSPNAREVDIAHVPVQKMAFPSCFLFIYWVLKLSRACDASYCHRGIHHSRLCIKTAFLIGLSFLLRLGHVKIFRLRHFRAPVLVGDRLQIHNWLCTCTLDQLVRVAKCDR